MIWLLIGYIWLFIHRPFEEWPWLGAMRIERMYMIMVIGVWVLSGPALIRWNRIYTGFILLTGVVLTSWLASPYPTHGEWSVENYLKYLVFFVLLVTSVRNTNDLRMILLGYVGAVGIFMAHSMREAFAGRINWDSQGVHRMVGVGNTFSHPNDFAGLITMSLPFVYPLWFEARKWWHKGAILAYVGLTVWCVIRTNSRMGMCGILMAGLLLVLVSGPVWRRRLLFLSPLLLVALWWIIPVETRNRFYTLIDPSSANAAAQASSGRFRYSGFERGLRLMGERPLLGYGPGTSAVAAGEGSQAHNTYGQVLGELGLVGTAAFLMILFAIGKNALESRRIASHLPWNADQLPYRMVLAATGAYVLALFMGWGLHFFFWHIWLWFGAFQAMAIACLHQQAAEHEYRDEDEDLETELDDYSERIQLQA